MLPEQQQRILGYFIEEAKDHLNTIEQGLLNLQSTLSDSEMINEVFRAAHSIKGGAAMLGLTSIQRTAHRLEDCFKVLKENPVKVDQKLESWFLAVSDTLKALLEHLQEPFGLTEEIANTLMAEAEPVFGWLNEHLELLVKQGGSAVQISTPPSVVSPPPVISQSPPETDKSQQLQNQVIQTLREMLQLFKQTATPENRQSLQQSCQQLVLLGQEQNLFRWCNLCRTAEAAVANPDNSYLDIAKIVITEIKKALELVLENRESEITISQQLNALLPIVKNEISAEIYEFKTSEVTFDIATTTENIDLDVEENLAYAETSALDLIDNYEDNINQDQLIITSTDSSGPEVGAAEYNTLAQLFDRNTFDFNEWEIEQDNLISITDDELDIDFIDEENNEINSEIEELLSLEQETDSDQEQLIGEDINLVELLDDFFVEVVESQSEDLPNVLDIVIDDRIKDLSLQSSNQSLVNEVTTNQDNFEELFTEIETVEKHTQSLVNEVTTNQDNFEELFIEIETVEKHTQSLVNEVITNQDNFEELFTEIETVEKHTQEVSFSSADNFDELLLSIYNTEELVDDIEQIFDTNLNLENDESGIIDSELESEPEYKLTNTSPFDDLFDVLPLTSTEFSQTFWEEDSAENDSTVSKTIQDIWTPISPTEEDSSLISASFDMEDLDIRFVDSNESVSFNIGEHILSPQQPEIVESTPEFTNLSTSKHTETEVDRFDTINQEENESLEILLSNLPTYSLENEGDFLPHSEATEIIDFEARDNFGEFADLEALLIEENQEAILEKDNSSETIAISVQNIDDPFSDIDKLLQEADKSILSSQSRKPATTRRPTKHDHTMRVSVKHLDEFSNLVGELVVNRNTLEQDQERLRQSLDNLLIQVQQLSDVGSRMQDLYERSLLEASLLASRKGNGFSNADTDRGFSELEMDRFTPFHSLSQEMIELIVKVRESASDIDFVTEETERVARQFRQVSGQLQEGLTRARMVPFAQATDRLQRGVRDNAIKCGKQAELMIEGRDTLIDKMILEHLTDPLTHMLNNAIAHGIENPEERAARGKPAMGIVSVRAFHQGNQTVIAVSDDGAGIDPDWVKSKAISKGLITSEEAKNMSPIDVYDLLFLPGFSTADQVDDIKGRGVGMDVVRTSISEIRGTINIDSAKGRGTTFTIRLPLTLSICKALCCVSDRARIAFPMDGVEDTLDIPAKQIQQTTDGKSYIFWREIMLPLKPLKELLSFNRQLSRGNVYGGNRDDDMFSVLVVRSGNTLIALQVDQVLNEQEIVIKQFEGPAPKPIGVAGATVLGDGRIMPIADVLEIIEIFEGRVNKQAIRQSKTPVISEKQSVKIDPTVLIVDDSITVRELLSLTFNKAGYRVEQARDGQEAWDKLRSGLPCDIVFCDIEMPRCDGLELLSRIQKESSFNQLPIAMLTSRGADKHRQMAIELGASGYFTKPYLEEALLDAASRILKGEKLVNGGNG